MASSLANGVTSDMIAATTSTSGIATLSTNKHITTSSLAQSAATLLSSSTSSHVAVGTLTTSTSSPISTSLPLVTAGPNHLNDSVDTTSISWGPDITAVPIPTQEASGNSSQPPPAHTGLSPKSRQITIAVSVIGGVLFIAILIYICSRRRKGATYSEVVTCRPHNPSTILSGTDAQEMRLTALPIYREYRYSVRSSKHPSLINLSHPPTNRKSLPSSKAARKLARQSASNPSAWKSAHPPTAPQTPLREVHGRSFLFDASPPQSVVSKPERARVIEPQQAPPKSSTRNSGPIVSIRRSTKTDDLEAGHATPPESPRSQHSTQLLKERWSWTNSQAPTTPRLAALSMRSSVGSLPGFRSIRSWVRGQNSRMAEKRPPMPKPRMPALKNKASIPKLAPISIT
ncbi:hypothetical protein LTR78_000386 [Recurvomyces mirabilis]|uniref:Uncharacterized protein n=1 Tax=Recurvomyces mirabilis TaxID=574656 RepID=A0AAE0WXS8_9PEZI|nr:hypothetical protein LTR78_000386 [Recurvomyces mirabilis]KAK5162041.1 hypothetical protein LTS14_000387 [Recurvomyces mirabilis]